MGVSNMKSLILCLTLICLVVTNQVQLGESKRIDPTVLDPCKRSGGKAPGCGHPDKNAPPQQANVYQRGCSIHHRCRG
ncbi:hypothetical protein Dsin_015395 [Dipteronia sinensis]|uniref:Rapid ALkalinization Factor n=1 Tax=Dipteronia sinensis TaxID=43782 RepID=A0AAE0ABG1_9ROSI|nr:hypothetical protein Dsin_015395 [Dipteronia sinensis]